MPRTGSTHCAAGSGPAPSAPCAATNSGSGVPDTGDLLDPILTRLGLDGLPRAHRVAVTVDLTLRLPTLSADRAFSLAYELTRGFMERSDRSWQWTRNGCTITSAIPLREADRWLIPWRPEYTTLVRGHPDRADATATAEEAIRAALTDALNSVGYEATITVDSLNYGFDPNPGCVNQKWPRSSPLSWPHRVG